MAGLAADIAAARRGYGARRAAAVPAARRRRALGAALLFGALMASPLAQCPAQTPDRRQGDPAAGLPDAWTAELVDGRTVRIDPRSNRPTVQIDGEQVQLWDGIHRLSDGGELTVIEGRVVPDRAMARERGMLPPPPSRPPARGPAARAGRELSPPGPMDSPSRRDAAPRNVTPDTAASAAQTPSDGEPAAADLRACRQLVSQACGDDGACADEEKCSVARQLADMAREEARADPHGYAVRDLIAKCREALVDDFFTACRSGPADGGSRGAGGAPAPSPAGTAQGR
jgi:hypothetical protein